MATRVIRRVDIVTVLLEGERIEDYPEDTPYPSALFFAPIVARPLHVVVAYSGDRRMAYVITAYEPDLDHFEEGFRTRRTQP
jgi:hypothetical protein